MKHTYRRRRHTSNWIYVIVSVCFLLITLCILSLIPEDSVGPETDNSLSPTVPESKLTHTPIPPQTGSSSPVYDALSQLPGDSFIAITLNRDKLSAVTEQFADNTVTTQQNSEQTELRLQEIAAAREVIIAERNEFQRQYEAESEPLAAEKSKAEEALEKSQTEADKLRQELEKVNENLISYEAQQAVLDQEEAILSEEKDKLIQSEEELHRLSEDIRHAHEQLANERRELESGIQNITDNPNLSSDGKETALLPLYSALEQLLLRESQLEQSKDEYSERSEELLAQKENYESRFHSYETDYNKLNEEYAPLIKKKEEQTAALQKTQTQITTIEAERQRIEAKARALTDEYQKKLQALAAEDEKFAQEEISLKEQAVSTQTGNSPDDISSVFSPETLSALLQDVLLYEHSDYKILLKDVADIHIINASSSAQNR